MRDLFEDLYILVGCEYISDMKFEPYLSKAKKALQTMNLSVYPQQQLDDLHMYLDK